MKVTTKLFQYVLVAFLVVGLSGCGTMYSVQTPQHTNVVDDSGAGGEDGSGTNTTID